MKQQEKRIKIAEACGWSHIETDRQFANGLTNQPNDGLIGISPINKKQNLLTRNCAWIIPDYFNDLNACHEIEKSIPKEVFYMMNLVKVMKETGTLGVRSDKTYRATATQRAEAFGLTLGLWEAGE
mgnify:CR=1 FL=1